MDAASDVAIISASSATTTTVIHTSANVFNVNQNNKNVHTHANAHSSSNSLTNKTTNNVINIGGSNNSSSSNSSCSSSSTSSNSSGYGSTTTTPTNNYDLQQTTPTTTPVPTTPVAIAEHIIPVATVAAVAPFYNESITTHNLDTHHVQHHHHHSQQQQQQHQQQQHHLLQPNHHQYSQNHLHTNLQQQHHQYLSRQQYYHPYDYQQTTPAHNLSGSPTTPAVAPYNMIIPGPYELSSSPATSTYGSGQYKASSSTNYEGSTGVKAIVAAPNYNQQQQQQSKVINQQTQHFTSLLAPSKQRSSTLINNSVNTNSSKPQAAATPFYANPTPLYDNFKHKMPLECHDTYGSPTASTATTYQQQQKYYAAAKSQLKEASYGSPAGLNGKSLYPNTGNFFPGATAGLNFSSATYDKYMYPHTSPTGYPASGHLGNEQNSADVSNFRKPVVANTVSSPSWPWGIDYASGNSRSIPPPASHLPTATVAPTHATHLAQNPSILARDPYYMSHDKYGVKYDKYASPSYQQSYVSPPANRHLWPNTPHGSNLTQLNDRHLLPTGPPALPSHSLHAAPYFPNNSPTGLNSRQSCCSQLYQPQSCYYPPSHPVPPRLPHSQTSTVASPTGGYLTAQQTLGQSPHLNPLSASCKYGGVLPDYGGGNKIKSSNDLYLNTHHYDNNLAVHNFGYGSGHNSQQLYATNAHQSLAHESTPASLLTNDSLNTNPTSYTNDLSLTTSNFDNYHTHLDTPHPSQQALAGMHNQQPPALYGPTAAKRALLDYRKPIQPQPPPTIAEDCYTNLTSSRDHYIQHELLNTPETTTTFGEYDVHQSNTTTLSNLPQPTAVLADADRATEESNKNLSLRDFIANWNDDEEEYQTNEEMTFDQDTVIDEVLQTAPIIQDAAAVAIEEAKVIKSSPLDTNNVEMLQESVKAVESLATALNDPDANQYINLPDIVIDIEKSNNINSSIITPTTSPTPPPQDNVNSTTLNLTSFDVEKELDELNLKKPVQQDSTKDPSVIKVSKIATTPQLSPCKNVTSQLSFEDLNLEPANKTVLNAITTPLTDNHISRLNDQYFKDIEGYESSSSRHSNESAFEKEYETFINKITGESSANKSAEVKIDDADKEIDFVQNVHDFSKFYKRKRKLRENELVSSAQATQNNKKLKATVPSEVSNSNFPQVYTRKSRNRLNKSKIQRPRRPLSTFYKIIHSIRRIGLYRQKRVREYMTDLKEKHLPLIKRQSIKNYTPERYKTFIDAKSLKSLCIIVINTDEFRHSLMSTIAQEQENCLESEEKHICMDPACETCEVIKSLMEAENFETTLVQQVTENNDKNISFSTPIFCGENNNESMTRLQDTQSTVDLNFRNEENTTISSAIENVQYSKENFLTFDTKDLHKDSFLSTDTDIHINDFHKTEPAVGFESCYERSKCTNLDLPTKECCEISLQPTSEIEEIDTFKYDKLKSRSVSNELQNFEHADAVESKHAFRNYDQTSNLYPNKIFENSCNIKNISSEFNMVLNKVSITETKNTNPLSNEKYSPAKQDQESESEETDSSSDADSTSSDTEADLIEHSKDTYLYKKSNNSNESSDIDTEVDFDDENSLTSDSKQSYCSGDTKSSKSSTNRVRKELLEISGLYNDETKLQKLSPASVNDIKTDPVDFIQKNMQSSFGAHSENEDENISKSPQRIVIRITKSLSPNDQSLRVENVFGKSLKTQVEFDNQIECESKNDEISDRKTEISAPLKLVIRRKDSTGDDAATTKSLTARAEGENNSESEFEDDDISESNFESDIKNINFSGKQKSAHEKLIEERSASDLEEREILEKKPELLSSLKFGSLKEINDKCDGNKENESAMISISSKFDSKEADINKVQITKEEFHSKVDDPENISDTEAEVVATSSKFGTKPEDCFKDCSSEKFLQSLAKSNLEDIIPEAKSDIISTSLRLCCNQEIFKKLEVEKCLKARVNNIHRELEDDDDKSIDKFETISLRVKSMQEDSITNNGFQKASAFITEPENDRENAGENDNFKTESDVITYNTIENNTEGMGEELDKTTKMSSEMGQYTESESEAECKDAEQIKRKESDLISSSFAINQRQEDIKKETTQADIEIYNLTDSEGESDKKEEESDKEEEESDKEEGESDKESDKDINSQRDDHEIGPSDYESIYDSEHETDDNEETFEPIKRLRTYACKPIVISDNESISQKYRSSSESQGTNESEELASNKDDEMLNKIQKQNADSSNNLINLDLKLTEKYKDKKEPIVIDQSKEEGEISDGEPNNKNKVTHSDEEIFDQSSDLSSTNCKKICNNDKCDKDLDYVETPLEFPKQSATFEDISEKGNHCFLKTFNCESLRNIAHSLEQSKLQTYSSHMKDNALQKIETVTKESNSTEEKGEIQEILPENTDRRKLQITEPISEEILANSNTLQENNEGNILMESTNKLYNSQKVIVESEYESSGTTEVASNTAEETKGLVDKLNQIITEYEATESKEAPEDIKGPTSEICNLISEEKPHTPQVAIEEFFIIKEVEMEESNILENNTLETKEAIVQTIANESNINFQNILRKTNSMDSKEIHGAANSLRTTCTNSTTLDVNWKEQSISSSVTEERESITRSLIKKRECFEDAKSLGGSTVEPIIENTIYLESSKINEQLKASGEKSTEIDRTGSEIFSGAITQESHCTDEADSKEIFDVIFNEGENIAENTTKSLTEEPSNNRSIDIFSESMENVSKSAAEKSEAASQDLETLENKKTEILENTFDHKTTVSCHLEIKESESKSVFSDIKGTKGQQEEEEKETTLREKTDDSDNSVETNTNFLNIIKERSRPTEEFEEGQQEEEEKETTLRAKTDDSDNSVETNTNFLNIIKEKSRPTEEFEEGQQEEEERAKTDDSDNSVETNTNFLNIFKEKSRPTEEFESTFETFKEVNTGEVLEHTIDEEREESDLGSLESKNENSDEVLKVSDQIESLAKCVNKGFEISCKAILATPESLKVQNNETSGSNDEEITIEIQKNFKLKNSNKAEEELPVIDNENLLKSESETSLDNTEIFKSFDEKLELCPETPSKGDKLVCVKTQEYDQSSTQHQTENFRLSLNENSIGNVFKNKNRIMPDDLSGDFFGFKHQCNFEDESEDFHGFEDLEEVTRIRQEIEDINDDSTANDGFLNDLLLERQTHKSSTSSLTESTFSELNELEALEKELSQPQPEIQTEDEDKEKDLLTKPVEVVSSNDIEHVKQMLESDEEQQTDGEDKCKDKSLENSKNISKHIISSINSIIPKLSDLCRAALNSSLNSNSNLAQQHTETSTILVERELSVEEALAEMYRQAGVLLSDPEDCDSDIPSPGGNEAHDVLLINLQEILNSDNNEVYVLQCDMRDNVLNVMHSTEEHEEERQENEVPSAERVNAVQIILDTQNREQHIHIISSDSESEVIILSDEDSDFGRRPFAPNQERVTIPFINDDDLNDSDDSFDISTIHHEEIVPDNLKKFLQEEFYKYLHEKYVQRNISKYYHANRVLKKYKRIFLRTKRQ